LTSAPGVTWLPSIDRDILLIDAGDFGVDDVGLVVLGDVRLDAQRLAAPFEAYRLEEAAKEVVEPRFGKWVVRTGGHPR